MSVGPYHDAEECVFLTSYYNFFDHSMGETVKIENKLVFPAAISRKIRSSYCH